MDEWRLIEPTAEYADEIAAYRREFLEAGDSMDGTGALRRAEDPMEWIAASARGKDPDGVPPGLAPATQFIAVRVSDGRVCGMIQVRHRFNEYLEKYGGHIGYSVRPSERGKGCAKWMLAHALPYCAEIGLDRVLVSCDEDNEGSRRTILANGGAYESTVFEPGEGIRLERYWIPTEE